MKELSVGTLIVDDSNILLGHITGMKNKWDIPKGRQEDGERLIDTAKRELFEEFGLIVPERKFKALGYFEYIPKKDLYLYVLEYSNLKKDINLNNLSCDSYFEQNNRLIPEIDGYSVVSFTKIKYYCYPSMIKVLEKILKI